MNMSRTTIVSKFTEEMLSRVDCGRHCAALVDDPYQTSAKLSGWYVTCVNRVGKPIFQFDFSV